jgi:ABC-2 type transport system ATP-binding protein
MPSISIENLEKTYQSGTHALKGLSFEIKKGEFFALLGPNGSGKSTLINIMSGFTKKSSGTIKIAGLDIDKHREETKHIIGVVPQEISFDPFFTVNEILNFQSGYYGIKNNQKYIDEILEKLNIQDKKHIGSRALSGGMKRRLLIAKALVHKPKIIVLDEPTAGVDVELRHNLWEYITLLNKEGLTILLTTHYLEEAESLCERVAIINQGELVALDKTKKLIRSMGDEKRVTITFEKPFKALPPCLKELKATTISDNEILLKVERGQIRKTLAHLDHCENAIDDIDIQNPKLEEIFIKLTHQKK